MAVFLNMFSAPRTPGTLYGPGQRFTLDVAPGSRAVVTDIYAENHGDSEARIILLEIHSGTGAEVRYQFRVPAGETIALSFSTGLRFGDLGVDIEGLMIQIEGSRVLPRINGYVDKSD